MPRARDIDGATVVPGRHGGPGRRSDWPAQQPNGAAPIEASSAPGTDEVTTMMRPPESGGRGPATAGELDDAEIEPKRGKPDMPAEGGPDNRLPGADPGSGLPGTQDDNLPERLGERIENGSSSAIAPGGSDLLPDVEPPETTM